MKIAIIPARGGSKRISNKNIRLFNGKPIIAWSIEAAIASNLFDHVIVSTDSEAIAEVARKYGAEVPFIRPLELSGDVVGVTDVISHAAKWVVEKGWNADAICCILATAPLIAIADIRKGFEDLIREKYFFVIAATNFASPIFRAFQKESRGVRMYFPDAFNSRSQDLPEALHDAAQFYWGTTTAWLNKYCAFGAGTGIVKIPRWRVQDIDTEDDWIMAEFLSAYVANNSSVCHEPIE
jgi:pseudaminic acid cytidylyltransferase